MKSNIALGLALVALVIAIFALIPSGAQPPLGQIADVSLFDRFNAGTTTPQNRGEFLGDSAATTSANLTSSGSGIGSCIQLKAVSGGSVRIYASSTPRVSNESLGQLSGLIVESGTCK